MMQLKRWLRSGCLALAVAAATASPAAGGLYEAKMHSAAMTEKAGAMVREGVMGHLEVMVGLAKDMRLHALEALKNLPADDPQGQQAKTHIEAAINDAEETITLGTMRQDQPAMMYARSAFEQAKKADAYLSRME